MTELLEIDPPRGSYYISSKSEPFDDEGFMEEKKRNNWLSFFDIPDDHFYQVHCSGHATPQQLEAMIQAIAPRYVFPVHTDHPETFNTMNLPETTVVEPIKGVTYNLLHL
jgi:mRNA degradation ribonuclease J1/J2